jgi:hypothetical protein
MSNLYIILTEQKSARLVPTSCTPTNTTNKPQISGAGNLSSNYHYSVTCTCRHSQVKQADPKNAIVCFSRGAIIALSASSLHSISPNNNIRNTSNAARVHQVQCQFLWTEQYMYVIQTDLHTHNHKTKIEKIASNTQQQNTILSQLEYVEFVWTLHV